MGLRHTRYRLLMCRSSYVSGRIELVPRHCYLVPFEMRRSRARQSAAPSDHLQRL